MQGFCKYNQKREKTRPLPCACTRQRNQMSSAVCLLTAKETRVIRLCCWEGKLAICIESLSCLDTRHRQSARHNARHTAYKSTRQTTPGPRQSKCPRQTAHGSSIDRGHTAKPGTRQTTPGPRQSNSPRQTAHGSSVDRGHTEKAGTRQREQELTAKIVRTEDCSWGFRGIAAVQRIVCTCVSFGETLWID
jgi:hypothetical protein